MTDRPVLRRCPRKGCPWRGPDPRACPFHASEDAWGRQGALLPANRLPLRYTRHRNT